MVYSPALEGIIVGETAISDVDGEVGVLTYRGRSVGDLVDIPVLQVASELACGDAAGEEFSEFMRKHSSLKPTELATLGSFDSNLHPMLMLQAMLPILQSDADPDLPLPLAAPRIQHGFALAAKIPALLINWRRLQMGQDTQPIAFGEDPILSFLQNFPLADSSATAVRTLNAAQVLQMEHSFNVSTFAGRVCASTDAPIESVLSVSIGTLYGPLHGGADQAALEMAIEIGHPDNAAEFVAQALASKRKIMGMGHREYKTVDPRAKILKPLAAELCTDPDKQRIFDTLVAVEQACQQHFSEQGKQIWANVEFYKGAVFYALGIPPDYFTALFAMARVFGYLAHYEEFRQNPRLIRPRAQYVGS